MAYESSSFSRTKENEAKMGAYYTDLAHCKDIGKLFRFPDEEVCVLEPSIGDASAVITVTGAERNSNIKIFGVELNDATARSTKENPCVTALLQADFTNGVYIRKNCFSFAFGNPPYLAEKDENGEKNVRLERVFLDKIVNYLKIGGILVWVIPYNAFIEKSYLRMWMQDFETLAVYKFRGSEYAKYHQIVLVGRRTRTHSPLAPEIAAYYDQWHLSDVPELPSDLSPCIDVMPSYEKDVDLFATRQLDCDAALQYLSKSISDDLCLAFDSNVSQKSYGEQKLGNPPIPLKKDSKYLLVTAGFTDGVVGSVATNDLHMMRGVANVVENIHYSDFDEEEAGNDSNTMTVTTSTQMEIRVLENNGTITLL